MAAYRSPAVAIAVLAAVVAYTLRGNAAPMRAYIGAHTPDSSDPKSCGKWIDFVNLSQILLHAVENTTEFLMSDCAWQPRKRYREGDT